jgi:mRNA deadenylase 3'-5' endonuclease subunit Ccr4
MKESQSITNNLLLEVDVLSNRLRNIKQSFKTTHNKALKERLFSENKNIFKRVNEISKIAELLNKKSNEKINFSNLLVEITKRTLNENKFESNLFFI